MRTFVSIVLAIAALLVVAGRVAAHDPTGGSVLEYPPGTSLLYRFGATGYPSWMQTATQAALGPDWTSSTWNNTRLPSFTFTPSGSGAVYYSSSAASPCGTGNTQWLQCASNWGSTAWRIYVRNFSGAPYGSWTWCNIAFSGICWDVERALIHEAEHVTLGVAGHDSQGEASTIMGSVSPWYANPGWNTHHVQRCDEAAGQLASGIGSAFGPLADCFDHVAGHGGTGLVPSITPSATAVSACLSQAAALSGSFRIATNSGYQSLSGQTLAGRTVWFDRKPSGSSTWTLNVASTTTTAGSSNWTRSFATGSTTTVAYDFRPHTAAESGLDGTTGPTITVTWRSGC